jgi:hypothetical protein
MCTLKKILYSFGVLLSFLFIVPVAWGQEGDAIIVNHNCCQLGQIPLEYLESAKSNLHIAYGHTSHGSQLTTGMSGLVNFINGGGLGLVFTEYFFAWNNGGTGGALDLRDTPFSGASDLGNPDRTAWATATRDYLSGHQDVNVIIWSWCGQVNGNSLDIVTYLTLMDSLERDYPEVQFIYMTGHLNGTGIEGNVNQRNEQIRTYCNNNAKILYDFADIESYDPDGNYYLDKAANDSCNYDSDGNGSRDKNWAVDWQNDHTEGMDWYDCSSAHSVELNANRKAYAAWWLWARLAGWEGVTPTFLNDFSNQSPDKFELYQNYPNPFNAATKISYSVANCSMVSLKVYDMLGKEVQTLVHQYQNPGRYSIVFDAMELASDIYFYQLQIGNNMLKTNKMVLLR